MTALQILNPTPSVMTDINGIAEFLELNYDAIINSMDISDKSKKTYYSNGKEFLKFVAANGFNIDSFRNYKAYLLKRTDIQDESKKQKLITAKAILDDLHYHRRILPFDIAKGIKNIKTDTGHKKDGLNSEEVSKVKLYIDSITDTTKRTRLKAMFNLLMLQGLRQFEVCNILIEDITLNDCQMRIKGKGSETKKPIDLHPDTCKALKDYLSTSGKRSGYLFTSEKGTTKGEKLTERGFRKIFDTVFDALQIDRSTHGFRHFFVTRMLEATNGNIGIVKQFSRHKSTQALMMYDDRKRKKEQLPMYYEAFAGI